MTVTWSGYATAELVAIKQSIERRSPAAAEAVGNRIVQRSQTLADFPLIGPIVPEYEADGIREILEPPYRIFYRVLEDYVEVVWVRHGAQRLPRTLPLSP